MLINNLLASQWMDVTNVVEKEIVHFAHVVNVTTRNNNVDAKNVLDVLFVN